MKKIKILFLAVLGELVKVLCKMRWIRPKYGINTSEIRDKKVIVSLTSYGRRVSNVLQYTIISLLRQTYKPDMIILWLDKDNWNDENLPKSIKRLVKYGLSIRYCDDLKSYKKLIPSLKAFPDDLIITCDDDIYYLNSMVGRLVVEYHNNPTQIYTHRAHRITWNDENVLASYDDWEEEVSGVGGFEIFPTGGGGCLYQRNLLYPDICDESLFMRLSPKADDVWFYFMEYLQGTCCYVLPYKEFIYIPLDAFYQHFHKDSNLSNSNVKECQNDVQIQNVISYYQINFGSKEVLK